MCAVRLCSRFRITTGDVRALALIPVLALLLIAQARLTQAQSSQYAKTRAFALVIGQSQYAQAPKLVNARNDAVAINSTLRDLGFESTLVLDGDKAAIERAVIEFSQRIKSAEVLFVYYAGHALQHRSTNFMVPIDGKTSPDVEFDVDFVSFTKLIQTIEAAAPKGAAKVYVLDACRDNPWTAISSHQTGSRHLGLNSVGTTDGRPDATSAVDGYFRIIAFATAAGQVANDGSGDHSPYTQSLLRFLPQQGLEVTEIFRQAAADVQRDTGGQQRPEYVVQTSRPLFLRVPYVTDCDREAIEGQNFLGIAGIPFDDIIAAKAIPACEAALKQLPDSARINNNIARAYEKAERLGEALKHYKLSADAGYAPAINALGIMYLAGCGLPGPDIEAGIKLIANARALGNLSARASLTSHDLLPYISEDARKMLATRLRDHGVAAPAARADVAALRAPLQAFQRKNDLANRGLTLETINALELYSIVPTKFKCH